MRVLAALARLLDEPGGWVAFLRLVERVFSPGLLSERSESKLCEVSMRVLAALARLLDEPGAGWLFAGLLSECSHQAC
ncbi:hypothetical protein Y710_01940 [Gordonia sp. QH-12]|nr:hypothetical protein Y710_01940 [Gordonia sp. QH-12]